MAKKLSSAIGVDLGSRNIKIAEVKLQGRQPVITALGMAPTPEGAIDQQGINDPRAVSAALKQLIAASGASTPDLVISLAGQGSVMVRTLEVPNMSDSELKQHMDWEITRNIPFSESTVVNDYKAFPPESPNAQNMDVVMAIAPQSVVDMMVDLVKQAGKKAGAFDVEPLSVARCLKVSYDTDFQGKTVCVVETGHKMTVINIYKDGKLLMTRQVPTGGELVTQTMASTLGLTNDEAERIKLTEARVPASAGAFNSYGGGGGGGYNPFASDTTAAMPTYNPFAGDAPAPVPVEAEPVQSGEDARILSLYNGMAPVVEDIGSEVRKSVDYFRSKGGEVDHILLAGGTAGLSGLDSFLQRLLAIPVDRFDPFKGLTVNARKADPTLLDEHRSEFVVAVGNGLHICF